VNHGEQQDFLYRVILSGYLTPSCAAQQLRNPRYYRAEVHLFEGSPGYERVGVGRPGGRNLLHRGARPGGAAPRPALPFADERSGTAGTCAISPARIHRRMQSLHTLHGARQE
uniref:hypothetical protein n=1 Tax=Stenotrophomonas sepilia TaxID=2860290 RepID=UPI002E7A59BA